MIITVITFIFYHYVFNYLNFFVSLLMLCAIIILQASSIGKNSYTKRMVILKLNFSYFAFLIQSNKVLMKLQSKTIAIHNYESSFLFLENSERIANKKREKLKSFLYLRVAQRLFISLNCFVKL